MFHLIRPMHDEIRGFLAQRASDDLSYGPLGLTRAESLPSISGRWKVDRQRVLLGRGETTFRRACEALAAWKMFPPAMAEIYWPTPPALGQNVAVLLVGAPLAVLCACRVVEVFDETVRGISRFGFAYGTLPEHIERGEERFTIEWNHGDDAVWYEIICVSQPQHWLAKLGQPMVHWQQARFRRLSGLAMQRAVPNALTPSRVPA